MRYAKIWIWAITAEQTAARNIFHMTDLGKIFIEGWKRASMGKMVNIPNLEIFGS